MFRYPNKFKNNLRDKLDISKIIDIFTSVDMENTPHESRMYFLMNFTGGVFSGKTFVHTVPNKIITLTKHENHTGRIWALGLDSMDQAQQGQYKKKTKG